MKILFLTLLDIKTVDDKSIYMDLLDEMISRGNEVVVVSPNERKNSKETYILEKPGMKLIKARTGNLFNVGIITKGISQVLLSYDYAKAIRKYAKCGKMHTKKAYNFDLILYSTPPITLTKVIKKLKRKTGARTYLLLKDIFPQNAVDLGMMQTDGLKGLLYKHFKKQENELYSISDSIGCMSMANIKYLLKHNPITPRKIEECPNSIKVEDLSINSQIRSEMRKRYKLPEDKLIFVYGGNLGKPQDIPFALECIKAASKNLNVHFLIVGDGTEYATVDKYATSVGANGNITLMKRLAKDDYDRMVAACDVGLLFLDHRFTIPNFPSRILSYMQSRLPVLAVTDEITDIGEIAEREGFGMKVTTGKTEDFIKAINKLSQSEKMKEMGDRAYEYLLRNYNVTRCCDIILNK